VLGLGSEHSSDPYRSVHVVEAREPALASTGGGVLPASSAYTGHGAARAGARGPSVSLRRTGAARTADKIFARCTLHVPSARRSRSLPLPRAAASTSTSASRPPSPCRRCLMCPHIRPPRAVSQPQNSACAYVRARLRAIGVGFRAGGRAVKTGAQTACQQARNRKLPCALEARASNDRGISLDDASCARSAEVGVTKGVRCGGGRLGSTGASFGGALASMWRASATHDSAEAWQDCARMSRRSTPTSNLAPPMNMATSLYVNVTCKLRASALARTVRATLAPECGLKPTVR